jgi:hypothetical protein
MIQQHFFLGLDLGQSADFSALAILEQQGYGADSAFHCRHLQRWPLKTSYPAIVADTARIVNSIGLLHNHARQVVSRQVLAIDATGVGAPVVDLFRRERINAELRPIQITGGDAVTKAEGVTRVPKRDLVSVAQVALQSDRLRIAATLPDALTLTREMQNFQVKITDSANDTYGAWREGAHDDLVLAVALALWVAKSETQREPTRVSNYLYDEDELNDWRMN